MVFIPKPQNRESALTYGDGDEAVFGFVADSAKDGYLLFHVRPTPKMKWRKQIQMTEVDGYDRFDGWWKKIYRKDLCKQLSFDPDFPMWLILCDWNGNEQTPLMEYFVRCVDLIERNRYLENKVKNYQSALNRKSIEGKKRAMHPDEDFLVFEERVKKLIQAGVITPAIVQQQPKEMGAEE